MAGVPDPGRYWAGSGPFRALQSGFGFLTFALDHRQQFGEAAQLARYRRLLRLGRHRPQRASRQIRRGAFQRVGLPAGASNIAILKLFSQQGQVRWDFLEEPMNQLFRQPAMCFCLCGRIISTMSLKNAAFFALIGMTLLTVLLAIGFVRDFSAFLAGAIAALALLKSGVNLLASLSVTVFLYVFYTKQP